MAAVTHSLTAPFLVSSTDTSLRVRPSSILTRFRLPFPDASEGTVQTLPLKQLVLDGP